MSQIKQRAMSFNKGFFVVLFSILFAIEAAVCAAATRDEDVIASMTRTISDNNGDVTVTCEWLRRPGEMAITIDYHGYLSQEGMANAFLSVNGVQREFITLKQELPNRVQRIRLLSFNPTTQVKGVNRIRPLGPAEQVDYQLFRNTPYYKQFGSVQIELKFFANGRWDGDGNNGEGNYVFEFESPLDDMPKDHF